MKEDIVIVGGVRTAIGSFGGALKKLSPETLTRYVMQNVMKRGNVQPDWIEKVIWGCNFSPIDQNIARHVAYQSGIPEEVPGFTINSACGSSLQAIISATQAIHCNEVEIVMAGGTESMSNAPYIVDATRWGQRLRHAEMSDLFWKGMQEPPIGVGMGLTAENLAEKYNISRKEQDSFALLSHKRAIRAIDENRFSSEIIPLSIPRRGKESFIFDMDEHVRRDLSLEKLAELPPAFKDNGTVTAGNACGINDAASAVILMKKTKADELGLTTLAKVKEYYVTGVDPNYMGIGPVPAINGVLKKAGLTIHEIERFEINEAFAAQYLTCERELGLDRDKVNIYGGGIALGHPVGATGCRLVVTLMYGMLSNDQSLGIASLCAGGGMGFAILLERV